MYIGRALEEIFAGAVGLEKVAYSSQIMWDQACTKEELTSCMSLVITPVVMMNEDHEGHDGEWRWWSATSGDGGNGLGGEKNWIVRIMVVAVVMVMVAMMVMVTMLVT